MFTVSRRVINELVELTCAINFSLLFFVSSLGRSSLSFHGRRREHDSGNGAFNLPPNDYHISTTFVLMFFKSMRTPPPTTATSPPSSPLISNVMKYGNSLDPGLKSSYPDGSFLQNFNPTATTICIHD